MEEEKIEIIPHKDAGKKKGMRKKIAAMCFAVAFAVLGTGGFVATNYIGSSIEYVQAALTTTQTKTVQTKLKNWGYYTGAIDGVYGAKTKAAVKLFQQKNGLTADGVVGARTAAAMGITLAGTTTTSTTTSTTLTTTQVRSVQTKLKSWGYYTGTVDGIYGNNTRAAVKSFQSKNGLTADGVVGAKTAAALGITLSASAANSTSNNDLYLLAKCVHAEARGESYTGQVAVAAVILNRVKSASFPNTIAGVIYQPWAFTAVNDGQINLEPNQSAYNAARDAMNGWDPTYGAIYYYNPATATSKWIYNRKTTVTIGKHVFAV